MRRPVLAAALSAAFALGFFAERLVPPARAADAEPMTARIVNIMRMSDEEIGPLRPGTALRGRVLASAPGATVAVQSGDVAKHFHRDSDEIQYIVEGRGTFWLGDREQEVGPGDLVIIPKGTAHAGSHATSGRFKAIAIKTPPQSADDLHPVN